MSKKYRIGYLDEDEGYQAKFYQAFKNEFDIKKLRNEIIELFNTNEDVFIESLGVLILFLL